MARYIDVDKLAEYITTNYCKNCDIYDGEKCNACPMNDALNYIETFQTADVVPKSEVERLEKEIKALVAFKDYFCDLYGHGLEVANWHENGALEPFDNFYESAEEEYERSLT